MNKSPSTTDYDVIIVGGRPAGSTLAARLAQHDMRVLLLERATFPSKPAASSPIIYAPTLSMLDEIGADESAYAHNTAKIRRMVNDFSTMGGMVAQIDLPEVNGRDYAYAIDRARFDCALWETAAAFPSVDARQNMSVVDLLWDGGRVAGVTAKDQATRETHTFTAKAVVGADGRFSFVARKVNARERDVHDTHPTSLLYAYWRGVPYYDEQGAAAVAYAGGDGYGFLIMDSADDTAAIVVEGRMDVIAPEPGQAEAFYLDKLRRQENIWRRVKDAEMVTDVHGMRRVGNMYRQAGGSGWVLVGDAYYQKDPLAGMGIYDAVLSARVLSANLGAWHRGELAWSAAIARYDKTMRDKTLKMYRATLEQVEQAMYAKTLLPDFVQHAMTRWMMSDPDTTHRMGMMLTRQIEPDAVLPPRNMLISLLQGPLRDISGFLDAEIKRGA